LMRGIIEPPDSCSLKNRKDSDLFLMREIPYTSASLAGTVGEQ